MHKYIYTYVCLYMHDSNPRPGILAWGPMPKISNPGLGFSKLL